MDDSTTTSMQSSEKFHIAYQQLEDRMRTLATADGNVFLPNPEPDGTVHYILICMEPSLGRWACSEDEAKWKVEAGFRNFLYSVEDFILHFCARRYLCASGERYHITDLSKGAMLVGHADVSRYERYNRWYPLLEDEISLVATPTTCVVAIGKVVSEYLVRKQFVKPFTGVIHYSSLAGRARNEGLVGHEEYFLAFKDTVSLEDLIITAKSVLEESHVPDRFRDEAMLRLSRSQLTASRKKLIFNYKVSFESM